MSFTKDDIPDLRGKVFIITGGNSGVGFEASRHLALHGCHVIIATHRQRPDGTVPADEVDGPGAVAAIKNGHEDVQVEFMLLDLTSFRSIRSFVDAFKARGLPLHCLINNAGLQTPPDARTEQGFEVTLGLNFWGPFYLTQLLLPLLKASAPSRIVWVSSPIETLGEIDWNDIRGLNYKTDIRAYGTSKLWDLMAGFEINERLKGSGVESFVCHPGIARTDIFRKADHAKVASVITDWAQWLSGQKAESGALPLMYCATSPELTGKGGTLYGAWYKGPFTLNVFNTAQRTPGNPLANDPAARARFYDAALTVVQEEEAKLEGGGAAGGGKVGITSDQGLADLVAADVAQMGLSEPVAVRGMPAGKEQQRTAAQAAAEAPAGEA